ncbi:hypothetical protein ANO11243_050190 [Dothideomycetidae sp. 11243]|nr:hypothetical protein ANO11243_050190 [fungal sp. No.11243]
MISSLSCRSMARPVTGASRQPHVRVPRERVKVQEPFLSHVGICFMSFQDINRFESPWTTCLAHGHTEPSSVQTRRDEIESDISAWLCVVGAFALIAPSFGFMQSIGTLQSYLQLNQLHNVSTANVGWITGMYLFFNYFFNVQIGAICDRNGPVLLGCLGSAISVAAFLLLAQCTKYWQFMLCFGVFAAIGGALMATAAMSIVAKLFSRRRGLAMGVALTGSAVGSIVFPILLRSAFPGFGWQWSMRILAFMIAGITVPGLCFFWPYARLVAQLPAQTPTTRNMLVLDLSAFRSSSFILVAAGTFLLEFAVFGISGLLPTMAVRDGFTPEGGYTLIAILGATSFFGRLLPGFAADIVGPFNAIICMASFTLVFIGSLLIPFGSSRAVLYGFSALWGFGSGSFLSITPVCMGRTCATENYGRFWGTLTFCLSFAVLLSVPLGGLMLDRIGSQGLAGLLIAVVALGELCFFSARAVLIGKWLSPATLI